MTPEQFQSHQEQMEAHRRDFMEMWKLQFEQQTAHLKPNEIAEIMQMAWNGWRENRINKKP